MFPALTVESETIARLNAWLEGLNFRWRIDRQTALIFAAFGSSIVEALDVFMAIDRAACTRFPHCTVGWGFTSGIIRRKLADRKISLPEVAETLNLARGTGLSQVIIQPLFITPGEEYEKLLHLANRDPNLKFGRPLLWESGDCRRLLDVVDRSIAKGATNILVMHGNGKDPRFNKLLIQLAEEAELRELFGASLEGEPGLKAIPAAQKHSARSRWVHFIPVMLASGRHIREDILGEGPDAWRSFFPGCKISCAPALGENPVALELFFIRAEAAMASPSRGLTEQPVPVSDACRG